MGYAPTSRRNRRWTPGDRNRQARSEPQPQPPQPLHRLGHQRVLLAPRPSPGTSPRSAGTARRRPTARSRPIARGSGTATPPRRWRTSRSPQPFGALRVEEVRAARHLRLEADLLQRRDQLLQPAAVLRRALPSAISGCSQRRRGRLLDRHELAGVAVVLHVGEGLHDLRMAAHERRCRQPIMLKPFDIECTSTPTSFAPSTCRKLSGWPS